MARLKTYEAIIIVASILVAAFLMIAPWLTKERVEERLLNNTNTVEVAPIVRIGTLRGGVSTLDVIKAEGIDSRLGFNASVVLFSKTLDLANALAHGDIDVAVIPAEFVAKLREGGVNVTILAVDFYQNQAVVARNDTRASSLEDLLAGNATIAAFKPTGTYAMFRAYVKTLYGVDVDERVVNAPPPQLVEAFSKGEVDAIVIWEPFVSQLVADHGGVVVASFRDLWQRWDGHVGDNGVMIVYAARGDWAAGHGDLVEKLLQARSEAAREWNSNRDLALGILMEQYGLSRGAAELCWERLKMEESTHLTSGIVDNILAVWRLAREGGYIHADPGSLAAGAFWLPGRQP
ncbi:ABC transporter substrate-binding protein [Stetteria hydrogenophila]